MPSRALRTTVLALLVSLGFVEIASAYYSPRLGRFLSRDPIGEQGAVLVRHAATTGFIPRDPGVPATESHPYSYVQNAPIAFIDPLGLQASQPATQPVFPGAGTKIDPRDITSIYDYLSKVGDPGCGVCFRMNPRGFTFSMKATVLRVDAGCPKSKGDLEKGLALVAGAAKAKFWLTGFEEKCKPDKNHPGHGGHKSCKCECVNKKKLPKMYYKFDRTFYGVYLEYQIIRPYYKKGGCTGDFKLSAFLQLDGWYGECRAKCKT